MMYKKHKPTNTLNPYIGKRVLTSPELPRLINYRAI